MITAFGRMTLLVDDFDAATEFYGDMLGFEPIFDGELPDGTRLLHVGLPDQDPVGLWLLEPQAESAQDRVGAQTGGEPAMVLYTDDCRGDCERLERAGVEIRSGPTESPDDVHAHVVDPFGNELVLVERTDSESSKKKH